MKTFIEIETPLDSPRGKTLTEARELYLGKRLVSFFILLKEKIGLTIKAIEIAHVHFKAKDGNIKMIIYKYE